MSLLEGCAVHHGRLRRRQGLGILDRILGASPGGIARVRRAATLPSVGIPANRQVHFSSGGSPDSHTRTRRERPPLAETRVFEQGLGDAGLAFEVRDRQRSNSLPTESRRPSSGFANHSNAGRSTQTHHGVEQSRLQKPILRKRQFSSVSRGQAQGLSSRCSPRQAERITRAAGRRVEPSVLRYGSQAVVSGHSKTEIRLWGKCPNAPLVSQREPVTDSHCACGPPDAFAKVSGNMSR